MRQDKTLASVIDPDPGATRSTDLEELGGLVDGAKLFTTHRALAVPFTPLSSSFCII